MPKHSLRLPAPYRNAFAAPSVNRSEAACIRAEQRIFIAGEAARFAALAKTRTLGDIRATCPARRRYL
jgi:hypothetical protein